MGIGRLGFRLRSAGVWDLLLRHKLTKTMNFLTLLLGKTFHLVGTLEKFVLQGQ